MPVILDRKVPALYRSCYKGAVRTLQYQSEDYDTPEGVSFNEVSLESQPEDIETLKYIEGLCLIKINDGSNHKIWNKEEVR